MKFTTPPNKSYSQDIKILHEALSKNEHISFSKFCDGEWAVIQNIPINNKEFWFDPNREEDQNKRQALINAFQYNNNRYFVGITCVNVFGLDTHRNMVSLSKQPQERLTWADIWVNSNYMYYIKNIVSMFKKRPTILFCNSRGQIHNLPFKPQHVFPVGNNAWEESWNTIEDAKSFIKLHNIKDSIFLFCCGPFGNILCHQLTEFNKNNTYLDIGSTLNPFLLSQGFHRDYYMGDNYFSRMIGAWDQ